MDELVEKVSIEELPEQVVVEAAESVQPTFTLDTDIQTIGDVTAATDVASNMSPAMSDQLNAIIKRFQRRAEKLSGKCKKRGYHRYIDGRCVDCGEVLKE